MVAKYFFFLIFPLPFLASASTKLPNIVIFISDDHGRWESSVYGNQDVRTPTMEKLAKEGILFDHAYVASPACGPNRASLLSGLMPSRSGAESNHEMPHPDTQLMIGKIKAVGYEVAAFGKIAHGKKHAKMCDFDYLNLKSTNLAYHVKSYLEDRASDKPLCLLVGDRRPHVPWVKESAYDPTNIMLPKYLVDTPQTREHWARYLTDITAMDREMGEIDQLVRNHFNAEDYIFLFTSDHGGQWPFGKWNLYDLGTRVMLIVRWPGKIKAGSRTDAMISWVDIFPTLLELIDGDIPNDIDGRSFAKVLLGLKEKHREYIFTTHTSDGDKNIYPIRSVRSMNYKYIWNLFPNAYHSNHSDILRKDGAGAYWNSWDKMESKTQKAALLISRYYIRPEFEFFDMQNDPFEMNNLAMHPQYQKQLKEIAEVLKGWMNIQGDSVELDKVPYSISGPRPHNLPKFQK